MSRNERMRGGRSRKWKNRDSAERNERSERERNRESHGGERSGRRHESRGSASYERRQERRRSLGHVNPKEIEEKQKAIREFRENIVSCELCGEPITDIENAILNKGSENPVHFDCVISKLSETERLSQNERISYIGQGRFGILCFDSPYDQKHFTIKKIIEWEDRDSERGGWRNEMAGLFSQVK